jgi:hypothetical protein
VVFRVGEALSPEVTVVVHPVDTEIHSTVPPGWRWAVMIGGAPPSDIDYCANAGWAPTEQLAKFEGEVAGATAARACRIFGIPAAYRVLSIDHDPIVAGNDRLHFV